MKKSKTDISEIEFDEFKICVCGNITDLICVSCDKWFCDVCLSTCVQCEQLVCEECYKQDLCCLARPWGDKTERHLRDFYQNKLVVGDGMYYSNDNVKYGKDYRMEAVKRTIEHYVDTFNASSLSRCGREFVGDYFPNITKYVENEMRLKFVSFLSELFRLNCDVFISIFLNNDVREDLLTVMDESIRSNKKMQSYLIQHMMESKELFDSLKKRKLLDWNLVRHKYFPTVNHIDAMKWIEQNGVDVLNNEKHFKQFVFYSPSKIMEYLIVEKGMTVEYMSKNMSYVTLDVVRMVYRLKGIEGIRKIDPRKIWNDFESLKFLTSIGYKYNEEGTNSILIYAMVCLRAIKYEDLNENQSKTFNDYVKERDIKACKHLYPFMKEIRKRKIMTMLLCMKRQFPLFQKEIIWNILDYAYSRIKERG